MGICGGSDSEASGPANFKTLKTAAEHEEWKATDKHIFHIEVFTAKWCTACHDAKDKWKSLMKNNPDIMWAEVDIDVNKRVG